jgi:WhiB family redox-sensing transcriptional regulator
VSTSSWGIDEWDDEALHDFADSVIPSIEPLPDPGSLLQRPEWHKRAACRGKGVDEFFPPEGSSRIRGAIQCARCPVAKECLEYALDQPSLKGVWAGTSERARHGMRAAMALG